jgi:outer membrane protein OmpA-like peptidoglycan-associated protein
MLLSEPPAALDQDGDNNAPVFVAFSDLLACVLGIFVLFFVWIVSFEVSMASELAKERAESVQAKGQLQELKTALAGPLRAGLITFVNGTIGIRGSVLFDTASAELRPEGIALLSQLAEPLGSYLGSREEVLMVSGFTDDLPVKVSPQSPFRDNWELSVHRSLTVVRSLIGAGVPSGALFAAGFGENHPVAPNDSVENRAKNRRVELAPVPRPRKLDLPEGQAVQLPAATQEQPASVLSAAQPLPQPQDAPAAGTDAEPQLHAAAPAHAGAN